MANYFFDGTANVTAQKSDLVVVTANPSLFVSEAQVGSNVVITYNNGNTLTVQNTTLNDLPSVQLSNGAFSSGASGTVTTTTANALVFSPNSTTVDVSAGGTSTSVKAVFGGLGVSDPNDTADSIVIGGKGSFLVYGNAGSDTITQATAAFDSQSFVTVFGGKNDANGLTGDTITLDSTGNAGAKMAIYGGEGNDTITIVNSSTNANTTIFGGQGAIDPNDGNDTITFNGGGTVNIFGNAGSDSIFLGNASSGAFSTGLQASSNVTVHGGIGADSITIKVAAAAANVTVFGDENASGTVDTIVVGGTTGTTTIYGGRQAADADDGADAINYSGQGTANIYAAGGNDTVVINTSGANLNAAGASTAALGTASTVTGNASSLTNVFLGNGDDSISVLNASSSTGVTKIAGGAGNDQYTIGITANDATASTVALGSAGSGRATIVIDDYGVAGIDTMRINNGSSSTAGTVTAVTTTFNSLDEALNNAASGTANSNATVVTFGGDSYVVLDRSAGATFDASADLAIKLTGTSAVSAIAGTITLI